MFPTGGTGVAPMALESLAGIVAGTALDPLAVFDAPAPLRALGSFVLVSLFGAAVLYWRRDLVDSAIESSMERPLVSVVYGIMAYILVTFLSGYAFSQVAQLGVGGAFLPFAGVAVGGSALLLLAGLGYAVVGSRLTELGGERKPWVGVVLGAAISGVALALPVVVGVGAWIAVAAVGIGGPTRNYIHDARTAENEAEA